MGSQKSKPSAMEPVSMFTERNDGSRPEITGSVVLTLRRIVPEPIGAARASNISKIQMILTYFAAGSGFIWENVKSSTSTDDERIARSNGTHRQDLEHGVVERLPRSLYLGDAAARWPDAVREQHRRDVARRVAAEERARVARVVEGRGREVATALQREGSGEGGEVAGRAGLRMALSAGEEATAQAPANTLRGLKVASYLVRVEGRLCEPSQRARAERRIGDCREECHCGRIEQGHWRRRRCCCTLLRSCAPTVPGSLRAVHPHAREARHDVRRCAEDACVACRRQTKKQKRKREKRGWGAWIVHPPRACPTTASPFPPAMPPSAYEFSSDTTPWSTV